MIADGQSVDRRTLQMVRYAGFLFPVVLALYAIMLGIGAVDPAYKGNDILLGCITIGWVAVGIVMLLIPETKIKRYGMVFLAAQHLFAVAYLLFVSGFSNPFISGWMILFVASYNYLRDRGLFISTVIFCGAALIDIIWYSNDPSHILTTLLTLIAVLSIGIVMSIMSMSQAYDHDRLEKTEAEKTLQHGRVMTIVNNLTDAILTVNRHGIIELYNAASLGLFDTNKDLVGTPIDDIISLYDGDKKRFKLLSNLHKLKRVMYREDLTATISHEDYRLSLTCSPINTGDSGDAPGDSGYVLIIRDITKQKSLEDERDEFISVVSHELRTPITVAEGSLGNAIYMMDRPEIPHETLSDNVKNAHSQVLFLAKMVNDLSTLSRAERGVGDETEEIDIASLMHDLYNEYAPQADQKGLHMNIELDHQLGTTVASRLYLKELLQNFITNAIKYTKEGNVTISAKSLEDSKVLLLVRDSGIGISKSDQHHIFDKFFRSEDYRTRETGGTGLGLYVAVKLAKKLGTRIEMTSRLNHGSTFGFRLTITSKKGGQ